MLLFNYFWWKIEHGSDVEKALVMPNVIIVQKCEEADEYYVLQDEVVPAELYIRDYCFEAVISFQYLD